MKIKQNFVLRNIANEFVLIPIMDDSKSFNGIITVNETGAYIWEKLNLGLEFDEIVHNLLNEYDVDATKAKENTKEFIDELVKLGIVE